MLVLDVRVILGAALLTVFINAYRIQPRPNPAPLPPPKPPAMKPLKPQPHKLLPLPPLHNKSG